MEESPDAKGWRVTAELAHEELEKARHEAETQADRERENRAVLRSRAYNEGYRKGSRDVLWAVGFFAFLACGALIVNGRWMLSVLVVLGFAAFAAIVLNRTREPWE